MSHAILHIGTHKTGTTTIQDVFWANSAYLETKNVIYPRLEYPHSGHHGLIAQAVKLPATYHLGMDGMDRLRRLAARYARKNVTVFLSSEEFSRADENRCVDFDRIAAALSGFDRITVLCFLRPQWQFLQSIYLEISQTQNPPRPPALVAEATSTGQCRGLYMDYCALLTRLRRSFSPEQIKLVDFETVRQRKLGVLRAAAQPFGGQNWVPELRLVNNGHSNRSAPALAQWAANLLSEPYRASAQVRRATEVLFPDRPTCLLTRQEIQAMRSRFAASNAQLVQQQAAVDPLFRLSDPDPENDSVFREDVRLEDWLRIGQILARPLVA